MILDSTLDEKKGIPTRYLILLMIFVVTAVNYGDRATLSIAGTEVAKELAAGCWINLARKRFIHTVCFSGHCLPSCKALLMCSRSPGPGSPCSSCVLCWAFPKRPRFPPTPALWRPGFRPKSGVRLQLSLMPLSTSRWLCSRRCSAG